MIATPIGNKEDITLRALNKIKELEIFFVEDTREFQKLLQLFGIEKGAKKIFSYASHNMKEANQKALEFLEQGKDIGFLTDRGTPGISDPGSLLAKTAREAGFLVIPIPGVSSLSTLISVSGMPSKGIFFIGFFPEGKKERELLTSHIKNFNCTLCFFESPERIQKTLTFLKDVFPEGKIFVGREMTKHFEEYYFADLKKLEIEKVIEKGEYAVLLEPQKALEMTDGSLLEDEIQLRLKSDKEWAKILGAKLGIASSEIYNKLQKNKK